MREIKFRAWDKINKKMEEVDGYNLYIADGRMFEIYEASYAYETYMRKNDVTDKYILMQYTGLKDKNGKEIYEGDIISTDLDRPFNIVVFRNGAFMFQCHDNGKDYYDYMFSVDEEFDCWKFGEVIGNIYEHPHLLKGDENE